MKRLLKNLNLIWNKFKKSNDSFWDEVEEQLILNDIGASTASSIISDVRKHAFKENINNIETIKEFLKDKIVKILDNDTSSGSSIVKFSSEIPAVWMMVGVNGVGKTSSIAKIANLFKNQNKSILLTAADTYRAAAFEQIDHYAKLLDIEIVHHQRYSDPGAVVYDSIEKAIAKKIDLVLIDTAGRMHTSYNLMEELKKIKKVICKKLCREADEILMVIDSTTGQNAKIQASIFNEALDLTGIVLTKTDGTSKGGIVLTIKHELNIPIKFITSGEKINNIDFFDPIKFTEMLFNQE
ncbi:MAG: signal recognition particle-docking protein FtsY [Actinobacteria bacterium]|nr:signal recognition particle-docking protein FtsY [Actinomycetota bacterium]